MLSNYSRSEKIRLGIEVGKTTVKYGAIGLAGKAGCEVVGIVMDKHYDVMQKAASIDEKLGEEMVKNPVGDAAIKVSKARGDFWAKTFGITPGEQQAWREKYGINEPSYLQADSENANKGGVQQTVAQVEQPQIMSNYYQRTIGDYVGAAVLGGSLLVGLGLLYLKEFKNYLGRDKNGN